MGESKTADAVALHFIPSDGAPWAEFLKTKLSEKTYGLDVRLFDATDNSSVQEKCSVNILLFSPDFLDVESFEQFKCYSSKSSLAVLLGVEEADYREALTEKNGKHLHYWNIFETQANEDSVRFLLVDIIDVYEHAPNLEDANSDESQGSIGQTFSDYDKLPSPRPKPGYEHSDEPNRVYKIINLGGDEHQEVLVLLDRKEDRVITVDTEDPKDTNIKCESLDKAVYRCRITGDTEKIKVKTGDNIIGSGQIGSANLGQPKHKDSKENISNKNKLDNLRDILEDEIDPVCLLCNAMSLEHHSIPALDKELADRFARYRSLEELGKLFRKREPDRNESSEKGKWPSLLHFAADFNLTRFCEELLRFPGMIRQANTKNEDGHTPGSLAEIQGHTELSSKLKRISRKVDSGIGEEITKLPTLESLLTVSETLFGQSDNAITDHTKEKISQEPDEDKEDVYDVPPPTPHVIPKKNYVNQSGTKQASTEISEEEEDYVLPQFCNRDEIEKRKSGERNSLSSKNETEFTVETGTRGSYEDDDIAPNPKPCTKQVTLPSRRNLSDTNIPNEYMTMQSVKRTDTDDPVDTQGSVQTHSSFLNRHHCHSESEIKNVARDSEYKLETFALLDDDDETDSLFEKRSHHDMGNVSPPCACGNGLSKSAKRQRSGSIDYATRPHISKPKGFFGIVSAKLHIGKHRKNSLPADLAYEEKMARFKEPPKQDNRVSDISTTSSASTNSNSSIHDAIADLSLHSETVKEETEATIKHRKHSKHKSKNPFGNKKKLEPHRKSIRITHVLQDKNLTILELPKKKK